MSYRKIVIAGGGPAGLVAAIAARQVGFDVHVYEQAANFARVGGAVGIQSNGMRVLEAIGVLDRLLPHIEIVHEAGLEAPPGRRVSWANFHEIDIPHAGFAVALRYDLQELLLEAAREHGAHITFGHRCQSAFSTPDGCEIRLENGSSVHADLLFACDGHRSAVRDSLSFGVGRRMTAEAYLRTISGRAHPDRSRIGEFWHPDGRRVGAFPLPGNRTYVFMSVPLGRWKTILEYELDSFVASWRDFGEPVATLMRSIDWPAAVYDEIGDVHVDRWYGERTFLLGDAAHAMTPNLGQGANSAMTDALVLVNVLSDCARHGGWELAGARYSHIRKPFVTRTQSAAWFGGRMASWRSAPARKLRDTFLVLGNKLRPLRTSSMKLTAGYNPVEEPYLHAPLPAF